MENCTAPARLETWRVECRTPGQGHLTTVGDQIVRRSSLIVTSESHPHGRTLAVRLGGRTGVLRGQRSGFRDEDARKGATPGPRRRDRPAIRRVECPNLHRG